jgi:hypothetical protein
MTDWRETKRISDAAKRAECDAAELLQRLGIPDEATRWKRDADARAEAVRQADRERRREERRDRRERVESAAVMELRAEIEALRGALSEGDAMVLQTVTDAVMPCIEKICDGLQRKINEIGERVDRRLAAMESEVRGAIKRERAGEVFELPSLREVRKVN